jgi:hypothetical protein
MGRAKASGTVHGGHLPQADLDRDRIGFQFRPETAAR